MPINFAEKLIRAVMSSTAMTDMWKWVYIVRSRILPSKGSSLPHRGDKHF